MLSEPMLHNIPVESLHKLISAADELSRCPDLDSVCHQAVEVARTSLGLERCAIFLEGDGFLTGTYGTSLDAEITDEHNQRFPMNELWQQRIEALQPLGLRWHTVVETRREWDGEQAQAISPGWIAFTPIHSANQLIGLFFNDAAITGRALDPTTQELVVVFCSLLGSTIQRKRAEKALAEERNLLRTLIDSMPDYIYAKDSDARFVLANQATSHLAGLDNPEQLIGKTALEVFPPELAPQYYADDLTILRTGRPLINREELTGDHQGKRQWVLTTKVPLQDRQGHTVGLVGVTRDVTQFKQAQEALRQAKDELELRIQERVAELKQTNLALETEMAERKAAETTLTQERNLLRTLIDTVPANVYIKDTFSRFVDANTETALKLGQKSASDLIGKTDFDFFTPELAAKYFADEQAILQSGQPMLTIEEPTFDQRTGQNLWFLTTKAPILDAHGKVTGFVGVGLDITERKQAEETQRESERLRLALEKEKELGDLKTQFMLTVSHEFRTPLSVAFASAELLQQYYERMSLDQRQKHLLRVETQIKKVIDMLQDISLLIHARFDSLVLSREPAHLLTLCQAAIDQLGDFDGARQRIVIHADEHLPALLLDTRRMQYVFTNVLSNALKYSDPVTQVSIDLSRQEDGVVVQISDHGIGIPPEALEHIFEPFYRANNVGIVGGTGLGLSIVKEVVELHKGLLTVKSEVQQGTQIRIFLPN